MRYFERHTEPLFIMIKRTIHRTQEFLKFKPFAAIKQKLKEGYSIGDLRADLMSGAIVAVVAIPLGMALAIASGVAPQYGLYTVILGGGIVALLGGSRFQVTGPTAAFVVILAPIVQKYGLRGLLIAGFMAGLMLIAMGLARLGRFIQFIPYPVTTGFTSGIAVVIGTLQLKDFLGLHVAEMPERYVQKVGVLFHALPTLRWQELVVGSATLLVLIVWPKLNKKVPAPLVALTVATFGVLLTKRYYPQFEAATIRSVFENGIPQSLPHFMWPWELAPTSGSPQGAVDLDFIENMIAPAFAIAMLGAIESLLSAVVADGMAQTKHDPDAELVALGVGNVICPFFGGIPATGAIARTTTNIRFGAKSPFSAIFHAIFTLFTILLFAPYVSYLPMAALAALLMIVAYNMSEMKHFWHILTVGPRGDVLVLVLCFGLTVTFDMVVGVMVGVILAALLFMQRMASVTSSRFLTEETHPHLVEMSHKKFSHEIVVYEIAGPMFFGAAENAVEALNELADKVRSVIFVLESVPVMDVTGLVAFESAIEELVHEKKGVVLVGLRKQPRELMEKSRFFKRHPQIQLCHHLKEGIEKAQRQDG